MPNVQLNGITDDPIRFNNKVGADIIYTKYE